VLVQVDGFAGRSRRFNMPESMTDIFMPGPLNIGCNRWVPMFLFDIFLPQSLTLTSFRTIL
jgi:hypothetical protein